jgi:A/G-specific adenine glycosylase
LFWGTITHVQELLLTWYQQNKRDLPWRRTRDPYAIWISETMLQQTQVATAISYWERWLERFPTVISLANAPLDDVLKMWQGLGYYARARNLHKAAIVMRDQHAGVFPEKFDDVLTLPGVGRYTAGAVCSIALGQDTPIVDANVIRVLCRLYAIPGDPKSPKVQACLWEKATILIPTGQGRAFNQAMMELGALVCGKSPACKNCPLNAVCLAFAQGEVPRYPEFAPKKAFTEQTDVSAIVQNAQGQFLLIQRPPDGLWGGLWEFPRLTMHEWEDSPSAATRAVKEAVRGDATSEGEIVAKLKHGVTTRKITLLGVAASLVSEQLEASGCQTFIWSDLATLNTYPLSSPQAKLLAQLQERDNTTAIQPRLF